MTRRTRTTATVVGALALVATACSESASPPPAPGGPGVVTTAAPFDGTYRATVRRDADGVPHISGPNLEGVVYGQGYASAQDYACTLGDQILKVQGRRAEVLGPGAADANVDSDFAWRHIGIDGRARREWPTASDDVKTQFQAFVSGWNRYLGEVGAGGVKGWCAPDGWLRPITAEDLYSYARAVTLTASSAQVARYLGRAQPPAVAEGQPAALPAPEPPADAGEAERQVASNGWAIGKDRTEGAGGMLVANPHFPWEGELRFWEVQLTVPGVSNIYGAQLEGLPGVGIGFTEEFGWTHTVSAGNRLTAYTLTLVPGKPTSYRYDGGEKEMTSRREVVKVKGPGGTVEERERTLWSSEYGPVLDFPGVGWTTALTTTYRDANIDNDEFADQYLAMDSARSLDEFIDAHARYQGVPLFNTVAVSRDGRAWYADTSATPNLSAEAVRRYDEAVAAGGITATAADSGAVLLDGSDSTFQWVDAPGARDPGLVPYDRMPKVERADYVFNANDSFWLPNAEHVLEGDFSPLHGRQRTARSPRTRQNAVVLGDRSPDGPSGADGRFSFDELRAAALANEGYTAAELRDQVVARCRARSTVEVTALTDSEGAEALPAATVDLAPACDVLAAWDGRYDLESRGAHLWREFGGRFESRDLTRAGPLWAEPFDAADPVATPAGLAPAPADGPDPVLVNLARAVQVVTKAGKSLDATLGSLQYADRNGERVPVHGGGSADGVTNIVQYAGSTGSTEPFPTRGPVMAPRSSLTADGYPINYGTSFLLALAYTPDGPRAAAFVTYGNTGDRTSPWYVSQTRRFSDKDWRQVRFHEVDIAADPQLTTTELSG